MFWSLYSVQISLLYIYQTPADLYLISVLRAKAVKSTKSVDHYLLPLFYAT